MKIAIVGGGTSAWLTAAYLLNNIPGIRITVIDKEFGKTVGVGEATIIDFPEFIRRCGFKFEDWFVGVDATFKAGISFPNWKREGTEIWHPFFTNLTYKDFKSNIWDFYAFRGNELDYKEYSCMLYDTSVRHNKVDFTDLTSYAYHIDAGKLVQYIQSRISDRIRLIKKEVTEVVRNDTGEIDHLKLIDDSLESADLYIDCTGFLSLLKKQERVDVSDRLYCNTALAGRISYQNESEEKRPYVICDAVEHGWVWKIPVNSRLGTGLVFNRDITDIEDAKEYFYKYWNGRLSKDDMKVIDWTPYYIKNFWDKNVVSIGLSGGFIEPLESSGISLIIKGIQTLEQRLRHKFFNQHDIDLYNSSMIRLYEDVIDFVNMHYSDSEKTGKFWDYVRSKFTPSDTQNFFAEVIRNPEFRKTLPQTDDPNTNSIFGVDSWICWMAQYDYKFGVDRNDFISSIADETLKSFYKTEQLRKLRCLPHVDLIKYVRQEIDL